MDDPKTIAEMHRDLDLDKIDARVAEIAGTRTTPMPRLIIPESTPHAPGLQDPRRNPTTETK